jgi:LmbE family N-acetylglucosaminyl deacetylase
MSRVLGLDGHPVDEVLGCGGTIACHADYGGQVQVLIVAGGEPSRQQQHDRGQAIDELSDLVQAAQQTDLILGAQGVAAFTNCWKS